MLSFIITVYYGNYESEWLLGVKVTWYASWDGPGSPSPAPIKVRTAPTAIMYPPKNMEITAE